MSICFEAQSRVRDFKAFKKQHRAGFVYDGLVKRVGDLYRGAYGNSAMVQLVCLELCRECGTEFTPVRDLTPLAFDYFRARLGVPDGAWGYALWADGLPSGKVSSSAEYWLGLWADADGAGEHDRVAVARSMLEKLMGAQVADAHAIEEITI